MLAFRTIFPLSPDSTLQELINLSIKWINEAPRYSLARKIDNLYGKSEFSVAEASESFSCFCYNSQNANYACLVFTNETDGEKWTTEVVYKKERTLFSCSIALSFQNVAFENKLNEIKKPYLMTLIGKNKLYGRDGIFTTESIPHVFTSDEVDLASRIIRREFNSVLPCVYISYNSYGKKFIDAEKLAFKLAGMAHVFVEPNIYFSRDVQIKTNGKNPYRGNVGIFFPDGARKFFIPSDEESASDNIRKIVNSVKNILNFGFVPDDLSYSEIKAKMLKEKIQNSSLGENDSKDMIEFILSENENLSKQVDELKSQNSHYKSRINQLEEYFEDGNHSILRMGCERDSYDNQIYETIVEVLQECYKNIPIGTRKRKIIEDILEANPSTGDKEKISNKIKLALTGYDRLTSGIKTTFEELGITIEQAGKHYKVFFEDYPAIASTLACTVSDHRSGLNTVCDIKRQLL